MSEALTILEETPRLHAARHVDRAACFYLNCLARRTLRSLLTQDTGRLIAAGRLSGRVISSFWATCRASSLAWCAGRQLNSPSSKAI